MISLVVRVAPATWGMVRGEPGGVGEVFPLVGVARGGIQSSEDVGGEIWYDSPGLGLTPHPCAMFTFLHQGVPGVEL